MTHQPTHEVPIDRLARKRAGAKLGWYIHACVYLVVNVALTALSLHQGRHWAAFPALGWGLGLAVHGFLVFVLGTGSELRERMVQRERERLNARRP